MLRLLQPRTASPLRFTGAALVIAAALSTQSLTAQATSTSVEKFQHSPASEFDGFGKAVAIDGDRALVTSVGVDDEGAAFAYRRSGGVWTFDQKFRGTDTGYGDSFGFKLAINGEYAVIGSHWADLLPEYNVGAAYVFRDSGADWVQVQKLVAPDGQGQDMFGWSVALAGDLIVVGAIDDDDNGNLTGSAYVYRRSGATWAFEQKLHASSNDPQDEFGWEVATDGQTVLVSTVVDGEGGIASGAVYVFEHTGASWQETQRIIPPNAADGDWFGWDLDVDGDRLAIGAPKSDLGANNGGAVYTYRQTGSSWTLEDQFTPDKVLPEDVFGWAVALQGDRLVAGAPSTTIAGTTELFAGCLYQFHFDGTRWVQVHQWLTSDTSIDEWPAPNLGQTCDLDGTTVLGGAPFHDGGAINSGAAYRFELTDLGLEAVQAGGLLSLNTYGGLAGAPMGALLLDAGGAPLNLLLYLSAFDPAGEQSVAFPVSPSLSGLQATFLTGGFWQSGSPLALSQSVTVTFP